VQRWLLRIVAADTHIALIQSQIPPALEAGILTLALIGTVCLLLR